MKEPKILDKERILSLLKLKIYYIRVDITVNKLSLVTFIIQKIRQFRYRYIAKFYANRAFSNVCNQLIILLYKETNYEKSRTFLKNFK